MLLLIIMLSLEKGFPGLDHTLHALFSQRAVVEGG
jgi:hypothetical protein